MEQAAVSETDVRPETTAAFAPVGRNIVVLCMMNGEARQHEISIGPALVTTILSQLCVVS
jgi:hypothetical protein